MARCCKNCPGTCTGRLKETVKKFRGNSKVAMRNMPMPEVDEWEYDAGDAKSAAVPCDDEACSDKLCAKAMGQLSETQCLLEGGALHGAVHSDDGPSRVARVKRSLTVSKKDK